MIDRTDDYLLLVLGRNSSETCVKLQMFRGSELAIKRVELRTVTNLLLHFVDVPQDANQTMTTNKQFEQALEENKMVNVK